MSVKSELNWPGHISAQLRDGAWPGARAKYFYTTWGFNQYFQERKGEPGHGRLVIHAEARPWLFGLIVGWTVLYTNQQSPEDMEDMLLVTREVEHKLGEIRRRRAEAKAEAAKVEELAKQEMARRAAVGTKYEERVAHMKTLAPSDSQRKEMEALLNAGDPEVLFDSKMDAFKAGYVQGHTNAIKAVEGKR